MFRLLVAGVLLSPAILARPAHAALQDIAVRAAAQDALAVGEAADMLQSQLELLYYSVNGTVGVCGPMFTGGPGSAKLTAVTTVSPTVKQTSVTIYFDIACARPYITAQSTLTADGAGYAIAESATFAGPSGKAMGTLALNETASLGGSGDSVHATGTFTPVTPGVPPASLGLDCKVPAKAVPFTCTAGIAQDFPKLNRSIAALLRLKLSVAATKPYLVTFTGASTRRLVGSLGALSIDFDSDNALAIEGTGDAFGPVTVAGTITGSMLFLPPLSSWTVKDAEHDMQVPIAVANSSTRSLYGEVTGRTGRLSEIRADRTGTGDINTATRGRWFPVTAWIIGD